MVKEMRIVAVYLPMHNSFHQAIDRYSANTENKAAQYLFESPSADVRSCAHNDRQDNKAELGHRIEQRLVFVRAPEIAGRM